MDPRTPNFTGKNVQKLFTEIAKLITSSLDIQVVIEAIMEQVQIFFKPQNWSLLRIDEETKELYFVVAEGLDVKQVADIRLKIGEGIAGYVAASGKSKFVANARLDPHFSPMVDQLSGFQTTSVIAVPIRYQEKVLGVIELINTHENRKFRTREMQILETIADFSAIALTHAMLYTQVLSLATKDPLTLLYNRGRLNALVEEYSTHVSKRYIVVACIDVNNLKQINDTYGHKAGDKLLVVTAKEIIGCCRKNDFAFRIGGDEFILIIVNIKKENVEKIHQRLSKQLSDRAGPKVPFLGFAFGISAGLQQNISQLLTQADSAMYLHKRKSR